MSQHEVRDAVTQKPPCLPQSVPADHDHAAAFQFGGIQDFFGKIPGQRAAADSAGPASAGGFLRLSLDLAAYSGGNLCGFAGTAGLVEQLADVARRIGE